MHFGAVKAVDGLTLTVPQGELFAFLGPNGAGKTTTIRMMTGLLQPMQGTVRLCGHDMAREPLKAKAVLGYVPDVAVFYDKLTPLEFMRFIADIFAMDRARARDGTGRLFDQFALWEHANDQIESLSHGTRQRLAIASALVHDPEVIVIDEPMVGLDPIHARIVKDELKARSEAGATVFMSTHLLNIAEELADRIGIILRGRMVAMGTVDEVRAQASDVQGPLERVFLSMVKADDEQARLARAAALPESRPRGHDDDDDTGNPFAKAS